MTTTVSGDIRNGGGGGGEDRGGGGRGRNDEYDNDEYNDEDGIHVRRKVVDVGGVGKGLGMTGSD